VKSLAQQRFWDAGESALSCHTAEKGEAFEGGRDENRSASRCFWGMAVWVYVACRCLLHAGKKLLGHQTKQQPPGRQNAETAMPDEEAEQQRQEREQQRRWKLDDIEASIAANKERRLELTEIMQLNWQRAQRSLADRLAERQRSWESRGGRSDDY
jgi:hypothetical protein